MAERGNSRWPRAVAAIVVWSVSLAIGLGATLTLTAAPAAAAGTPNVALSKSQPASSLLGDPVPVTLTASSPAGQPVAYNVTFRDVLPVGVAYVPGSTTPTTAGEPKALANKPVAGQTTLIWSNVADLAPGGSTRIAFSVQPAVAPDPNAYAPGASFSDSASTYVQTDPRKIALFDANGNVVAGSYTGSATSQASTVIAPFAIAKSEPSPEGELMRGVHDHPTVYSLTVRGATVASTDNAVVVDFLPAGLEFLGCGGADNTTAGPEYPGAPGLTATPAVTGCRQPAAVSTVLADPDGAGPLSIGTFTRVEWDLGTLAAGQTVTLRYAAGIPLRANSVLFPGGAPDPDTLRQIANLDNNTGPETFDEQALTNAASVAGTYTGPVDPSSGPNFTVRDTETVTAEDLAIRKTADTGQFVQGGIVHWTFELRTGEYRSAEDLVITDTLPQGLCPLGTQNYDGDPDCAPVAGEQPTLPYDSVTKNADGSFTIVWRLSGMAPSTARTISFPARDKTDTGDVPTVGGNSYTNAVHVEAQAPSIPAIDLPDRTVSDDSTATLSTATPTVVKQVALPPPSGGAASCDGATYVDSPPATPPQYSKGDVVCFRVRMTFPTTINTLNASAVDFIPSVSTYVAGSARPTSANTATIAAFSESGGTLEWLLGDTFGRSRIVPAGQRFEATFAVTLNSGPANLTEADLVDNQLKGSSRSATGAYFTQRDIARINLIAPALTATKGVWRVDGSPAAGNPANSDNVTAAAGSAVQYRIDVTNGGDDAAVNGQVWDRVPPQVTACSAISGISNGGVCDGSTTPPIIKWSALSSLAPDATLTLTYTLTLPSNLAAGETLTNQAGVRSYQGEANTGTNPTYFPPSNIDPTVTATTGAPRADDTSLVQIPFTTATKRGTTSVTESGNTATQATVGETISYSVTLSVPAHSSLYSAVLSDPLPATVALVGAPTATVDGAAPPAGFSISAGANGRTPTLAFPATFTSSGSTPRSVVLSYQAQVLDVAANKRGSSIPNQAQVTYKTSTGASLSTKSNSVSTPVVEPVVTVTKAHAGTGPFFPNAPISFTLTVRNASGASVAHELVVVDTLPAGTSVVGTPSSGGVVDAVARTITWTLSSLNPNTATVLTYAAQIEPGSPAQQDFTNSVAVTSTSMAGTVAGERTYRATTTDTVQVGSVAIGKTVDRPQATIGNDLTYTLTGTLTQGVALFDPLFVDTLPAGVVFDRVLSQSCVNEVDDSACPFAPTFIPPTTNPDGTSNLAWSLTDIPNVPTNRTVTVTFLAHVSNASQSVPKAGDSLVNRVKLYWNLSNKLDPNPTTIPSSLGAYDRSTPEASAPTQVTEPSMRLAKTVTPTTAEPGDLLSYKVVPSNATGTFVSPAYAIVVKDVVPAGLDVLTATISNGGSYDAGTRTITWQIAGPVDAGGSLPLTYQVRMSSSTDPATSLVNRASIAAYSGIPDGPGDRGRLYAGPSATATVTAKAPTLDVAKTTADGLEEGTAFVEQPFGWKVVVRNTGTGTAHAVVATDTLPALWSYDDGSAIVTPPGGAPEAVDPAISGQTLTFTGLGDLAPGEQLTLIFTATADDSVASTPPGVGPAHPQVNSVLATAVDGAGSPGNSAGPYQDDDTAGAIIDDADLRVVKVPGSSSFVAGGEATWAIQVHNDGPSTASAPVRVRDVVPNGTTFVSATGPGWTCTLTGIDVLCERADLASGADAPPITFVATVDADRTEPVTNIAQVTSATLDSRPGNNISAVTRPVTTQADLAIDKEAVGEFVPGHSATYRLVVTNAGPSDAAPDLVVQDTLPTGVTFRAFDAPQWQCTAAGQDLTCTRDSALPAGATAPTIGVLVDLGSGLTGDLSNTARVDSPTPDPGPDNNSDTAVVPLTPSADLSLTKELQGRVSAGEPATYTLDVHNAGPSDAAAAVVVTDTLPAGLTFVSGTGSGWTCAATGQVVTCTRDTAVAAGDDAPTITLVATAGSDVLGSVVNTARVDSPTPDPVPENNEDADDSSVRTRADLQLTKTAATGSVVAGTAASWTVSVHNDGPAVSLADITVTDHLPDGLTYSSATGTGWNCNGSEQDVTCVRDTALRVGATAPAITIIADVDPAVLGVLTNNAVVDGTTEDPDRSNNADEATVQVTGRADLAVDKQGPATVTPGESATYTIDVTNTGPSAARGVAVSDQLPDGTTLVTATGSGWTCLNASPQVSCLRASSEPVGLGALPTITVVVRVAPGLTPPDTLTNGTQVTSTTPDPDLSNNSDDVTTTLTPSADLKLEKSHTTDLVIAGQPVTYELTITNDGPSVAQGPITVTDPLAAGLTFVSTTSAGWACQPAGSGFECTNPDALLPSTSTTVDVVVQVSADSSLAGPITNRATVTSPTPDPDESNNSDDDTVQVTLSADLALAKSQLPPTPAVIGEPVVYQLDVTNNGPSDDPGPVIVTDTVPDGLTPVSATGDDWACDPPDGQRITCTWADPMPVDSSTPHPILVTATVTAGAYPSVTNSAAVHGAATDPLPDNNIDTATTDVAPLVDLSVTKTHDEPVLVGADLTYLLTVGNAGPTDDPGPVRVVDTVPAGLRYVSAVGIGWDCSALGQRVTCQRADGLGAAATSRIALVVEVLPAAAPGVVNTVVVSSAATDADLGNNSASDPTTITPVADVSVVKSLGDLLIPDSQATYSLDVANAGPSTATSVQVSDQLPAGLQALRASGSGWSCTISGQLVGCDLTDPLPAGATASPISLVVTVTAASGATVTNAAAVRATELDPALGNNTSQVSGVVLDSSGGGGDQPSTGGGGGQPSSGGNGEGSGLPRTGAEIALLTLIAVLFIGAGIGMVSFRRREQSGPQG